MNDILATSARRQSDTLRQRLAWLSGAQKQDRPAVMEAIGYLMDRGLIVPTARAMNKSATIPAAERDAPSGGMDAETYAAARTPRQSTVTDTAGTPVTSDRFFEAG